MSSTTATSRHLVQFYDHDTFLLDGLARFLVAGLGQGEGGVVVATASHRRGIEERLVEAGVDLAAAREDGRYMALDAAELLSEITVDGWPNEDRFNEAIGALLARSRRRRPDAGVRVFGEMVALLWAEGRREAAIRLEELWNGLARRTPFVLLCAYPLDGFGREADAAPFLAVCGTHAEIVPAESYRTEAGTADRHRAIALLQQKARVLETEIAQRREVEETLRQRNQTLAALIAGSPLPIVVVAPDATVRLWNPAAERVFGWSEREVLGRPIPIVPPEKIIEAACVREAVVRGETFSRVETHRTRRDGTPIDLLISAAPLRDQHGAVHEMMLLFEDVTERNHAEAARQKALHEAESANRAKDEFLAMLGHELRNPLSAVRNAVVTARLDPERRDRALDIARRGTDQLGRLVDDLLDVARITQGKIALRMQRLTLAGVVERAVESTRQLIEERAHALTLSLPGADVHVDGDSTRLEQVVANLVTNAAKYADPGGRIEVSVTREGDDAVLRVRDDGCGIAPEMLPRVFDLFAQADRGLDRAQGGLGIGLTVVKQLAELHGGRVEARSDGLGKGAEFVVRLPALVAACEETLRVPSPERARSARARVLLVEDNADAAESLVLLLELLGHRVRVTRDGPSALEAARANVPDVMIVDIGLPGMDGYEVARQVRQDAGLRPILLVALTGYGREDDRRRALAAGFDYHLVKPVNPDALQGLVGQLPASVTLPKDPTIH